MNIKLRDLKPNPFRETATYPYSRQRLERLKDSIRTTGFWDNLIVRKHEFLEERKLIVHYQIAYGHHRLAALRELIAEQMIDEDYEIECPVRHLDDSAMVRIMASEQYNEDREQFDHTIKQVLAYVASAVSVKPSELTVSDLGMFLGCGYSTNSGERKIQAALRRINQ